MYHLEKCSPIEVAFKVARDKSRPNLPPLPNDITELIENCWDPNPELRPVFRKYTFNVLRLYKKEKDSYGSLQMMHKEMSETEL